MSKGQDFAVESLKLSARALGALALGDKETADIYMAAAKLFADGACRAAEAARSLGGDTK